MEPDNASPAPTADTGRAPGAEIPRRQVLQTVSGLVVGLFVAILAGTVVANAMPAMMADLGADQSAYSWIITAELLAMTATVPLWGKLADLYDKKLLVQLSLVLFVVGSLLAGLSQGVGLLILSRVIQGVGAGGLTTSTQIVLAAIIPPRQRGRYAGVFGAVFSSATVVGPLIGGVLVDTPWLGWRWCFFFGVPFGLLAIVLLQRTLHLPSTRREVKVDYLGAFLIVSGVSALLIWVSFAGNEFAWASWQTAALTLGGTLLLAAAVAVEARVPEPVIPPGIFRNRTVALTTVASLLVGIALFGGSVFLSQFFQMAMGASPTAAGLMSLPMVVGSLAASTVAGNLITRTGRWKPFLVAGAALMALGTALLATIDADTPFPLLSAYMVLLGTGVGMLTQNLILAAQNDVDPADLGATTSVLSFSRSMGGTIGTSVLGAVLAHRIAADLSTGSGGSGGAGDAASGASAHSFPDLSALPASARTLVENAYGDATADIFLCATPVAVLVLVAVLFVREKPLRTTNQEPETGSEPVRESGPRGESAGESARVASTSRV
ncbi:MDR family MFS transporter [Streptomyces sp. NPDC054784]